MIAHILFRLVYGGMENGIVNLVNGLPQDKFRHVVIALSEATQFRDRIIRNDVQVYALHKRVGKDFLAYWRLYKLLRQLKPNLVHTRNIGTWDCAIIAWLAGVPIRIHGEHGWDIDDPDGSSLKYIWIRRLLNRFVLRFITVSQDLQNYLVQVVGIIPKKTIHILNGVDTKKFVPRRGDMVSMLPADIFPVGCIVIGSVTRFNEIKDPLNLVQAFISLRRQLREQDVKIRLLMIGDGPLRASALKLLQEAGDADAAWLPGSRDDIPVLLSEIDVFVLGSLREGISNTLLEAMATGLPLVATLTGGNINLIESGVMGMLVPVANPQALASALLLYVNDDDLRRRHGAAARTRAESRYSLAYMLDNYSNLYSSLMQRK